MTEHDDLPAEATSPAEAASPALEVEAEEVNEDGTPVANPSPGVQLERRQATLPSPSEWAGMQAIAQAICNTEFVPDSFRGRPDAALAAILYGREVGIGAMQALKNINIIDGRPAPEAELMCALVRRQGHSITGGATAEHASVTGTRADTGDTMTVEWNLDMAQRAGLTGKRNWKTYPEAMLWARAVSQLCRQLFPDCLNGWSHTPDELGADDHQPDEGGEYVTTIEPPPVASRRAPRTANREDTKQQPALSSASQRKLVKTLVEECRAAGVFVTTAGDSIDDEQFAVSTANYYRLDEQQVANASGLDGVLELLGQEQASNLIERLQTLKKNAKAREAA